VLQNIKNTARPQLNYKITVIQARRLVIETFGLENYNFNKTTIRNLQAKNLQVLFYKII
jgi:hypothetical protein